MDPLPDSVLPLGVRSRILSGINGLDVHILEAGWAVDDRPAVLLLHGFPEIAYSWRKVLPALAAAGYHAIAPDQRGYGRTTGWDGHYDTDLAPFRFLNYVRDAMGVVTALGHDSVHAVVGHDFGTVPAAVAALVRPDLFERLVLMSAPFAGPPPRISSDPAPGPDLHAALAALARPRKHYQWYFSTDGANDDMWHAPQGVHDFLRAYFHYKSGDWAGNQPFPLASRTADELAKMPTYYVMDLGEGMASTVAEQMPSPDEIAANRWLTDDELAVYSAEYERTGFQGGLQLYRVFTSGSFNSDLEVFAGRTIDAPSMFIAGKSDWGIYQAPGALERMQHGVCTDMRAVHLVEGAGHWVQQENADAVNALLLNFLGST
jgi:pimeloyl-ACP methyl ester carboxylesterase